MAKKIKAVSQRALEADHATLRALENLPDYQPANPALGIPQLKQLQSLVINDQQNFEQLLFVIEEARRSGALNSHNYHSAMVMVRAAIPIQYGADSPVLEMVGLTRKSNYKQPTPRKGPAE